MLKKIIRTRTMGFPARTVCFCVFTISSAVLPFAACISIIQEEYNIIANRPLKLVCNIESTITNAVTIRTPDNSEAVACTPTVVTPPNPASCSSPGTVYTGSINETANTVTLITNMLPGDVNGTWTCSHGSNFEPFVFPNPIPCFTTESLVLTPSSFPGNITKDSTTLSLSVIYSCINVDITFKWILKAGTAHEYTSPSVTKDSSPCTDTATCTGVNAYTQVISSDAIFQFAKDQGLQGGYELTVEAHSSKGITALKSQSIVYFEFSVHTSTPTSVTKPPSDKKCFLEIPGIEDIPCGLIIGGILFIAALGFSKLLHIKFKTIKEESKKTQSKHYELENHDTSKDCAGSTVNKSFEDCANSKDGNQSVPKINDKESKYSANDEGVNKSSECMENIIQQKFVFNDDTHMGVKSEKNEDGINNAHKSLLHTKESQDGPYFKGVKKSHESKDNIKQIKNVSTDGTHMRFETDKDGSKLIETKIAIESKDE